jgi:hypothetical protein
MVWQQCQAEILLIWQTGDFHQFPRPAIQNLWYCRGAKLCVTCIVPAEGLQMLSWAAVLGERPCSKPCPLVRLEPSIPSFNDGAHGDCDIIMRLVVERAGKGLPYARVVWLSAVQLQHHTCARVCSD